ncbi:reverse transcriptase domain-containing protein [Amycolatopsis granulosa]|uniref:reverse transcriptase domain-containing protein n=1 Tax=Amycolatopsis granulosa TaxID=185684 RepID=UPI001421FEDB|nr:reverse transcriptase domain-containing protein [Amycolatopsis granulosa]NIH87506.1 hypothetical protein [Amycolatopsis granulosa]
MKMDAKLVSRLKLSDAIEAESKGDPDLLPRMPGWTEALKNSQKLEKWIKGRLQAGFFPSGQVNVATRKAHRGIRPLSIWGIPERIIYRAISDLVLAGEPALDRSPQAYLAFIGGPIEYARSSQPRLVEQPDSQTLLLGEFFSHITLEGSDVRYIVKTDLTAFYQYIDHAVLSSELTARSSEFEAIEFLGGFLGQVTGRGFGVPQLFDSSDRLSEIYAYMIERDLLRQGVPTWRFNDDFRIAATSFSEALDFIERVDSAAREVGLTINDAKTTTPKAATYAEENFGLAIDDEIPEHLVHNAPEDVVGDYTEGIGADDADWAVDVIQSTVVKSKKEKDTDFREIELTNLDGAQIKLLRRALRVLIRDKNPSVLSDVAKLVTYTPSLTPWVMQYVSQTGNADLEITRNFIKTVVTELSLSDWQRIWTLRMISDLELVGDENLERSTQITQWIEDMLYKQHTAPTRAEAALALSTVGRVKYKEVDILLRTQPDALASWYLQCASNLRSQQAMDEKQYRALRGTTPLFAALLPENP